MLKRTLVIVLPLLVASAAMSMASPVPDEPVQSDTAKPPKGQPAGEDDSELQAGQLLNLPFKTAGGTQFWTDYRWRDGYRIQQNALTGHWRLVDSKDFRRAWGTRHQCDLAMENLAPADRPSESSGHVVVLMHGLMRTHHSMKPLETALNQAEFDTVVRFSYASTRKSMSDHADALRQVLEDFPEDTTFSFVGHSMGNIVLRHTLGDLERAEDPSQVLPRCKSMVMLGPPNQGAAIARRLSKTGLFGLVTGEGGMELGPKWEEFVGKLAQPNFPFMIIAGDVSDNTVQNPLVDGTSDFVVSTEEAQLDGAEAFETVPVLHSFLMNDAKAVDITVKYLSKYRP